MDGKGRKFGVILLLILAVLGIGVGFIIVYSKFKVPNFGAMRSSLDMDILLANGDEALRAVGPKAPGWVPIDRISDFALMAVISSEDTTFYYHKGVDLHELQEAIKKDMREKRWARGASTLTQQVVKNAFLSREKTLWRKFREILWAAELEKEFTKSEILCFYMNMAEFGPGLYGIGAASTYYFGVVPSRLSVRESAFLAMLLPSPRKYHSYFRRKTLTPWAKKRVEHIIETMYRLGYIEEAARNQGLTESLWGSEQEDNSPGETAEPLGNADDGALDESDGEPDSPAPPAKVGDGPPPVPVTPDETPQAEPPEG